MPLRATLGTPWRRPRPPALTGSLGTLLIRGLIAGLIAGLLAGTVGFFLGEPKIEAAIALEEAAQTAQPESGGHTHGDSEEPLVSRTGQRMGEFLALGLSGLAFGAILGAVAATARRYTTLPGPWLGALLGLGGWIAIVAVPFFKYPANPPAVGDPDTINDRTLGWLAAVLLGIAAVSAGVFLWKLCAAALPSTLALSASIGAGLTLITIGYVVLPGFNEVGSDFPPSLLWEFRISSLAVSTTLWVSLGLAFAMLTEWAHRSAPAVLRTDQL